MTGEPAPEPSRSPRWGLLAAAAVVAGHVGLLLRLLRPHVLLGADPVRSTDHAMHWYRAKVAADHFLPSGRLWGYDPFHTAGTVTGTIHDLDNKAVEVFVFLFGGLIGDGAAFNWFLFLGYALVPVGFLLAARLLKLGWGTAACAAGVAVAAFHGDPYVANWTLFGGFGHVMASAAAPVIVAVLARRVEAPEARSAWWLLATAPLFYVHVLTAVFVAVLGLGLVPRALRSRPRELAATLGVVLLIVLVNLPWMGPMLQDWGRILPTPGTGGEPVPFLSGFVRLVVAGRVYGLLLPLVAGAAGVWVAWRRGRTAIALTWGLGGLLLFAGAFEGHRSELLRSLVEPARLKVTLPMALALPAGLALATAAERIRERAGALVVVLLVGVVAAVGHPWLLRPIAPRAFGSAHLRAALDPGAESLFERLRTLGDPRGRVAVEEIGPFDGGRPLFRSYVVSMAPLYTERAMIGGPYYRGFTAEKVAAFVNGKLVGRPITEMSDDEIAERLERYDVTGIAACSDAAIARLRATSDLLDEVGEVREGGERDRRYVLFAVRRASDATQLGDADVRATYDRIDVTPRSADPLVLRLHFDHRLEVPEPLRMTREPMPDGDPGFIRVEDHGGVPFSITLR